MEQEIRTGDPNTDREVVAEMKRRGPPRIRAYFDGEVWHAREGTHRLRAAKLLGLPPVLVPVRWRSLRGALFRTFELLTPEQKAAMVPASRSGDVTPGTVLDLWEGLATHGDFVMMYDEFVPIAEAVWPEVA